MSFEQPKSKNEERADKVMRMIRDGEYSSVPAAVRQILINELVTHEPDVKRIMSEVGAILQKRQQYAEEDEIHRELQKEEMLLGAQEARLQRGGDPEH
jgi:hypothetical protein